MVPGQKFQVLSRVPGSICPGIGLITRYSLLVRLGVSVQRMAESMDEGITALESADEEGAEYLDKHDGKSVGEYDDGREVAVGQETATANAFDALLQAAEGAADRIAKTTAAANSIGSSVESSHSLSSSQPGRPLDGVIGAKVSRGDWRASCEQQQWFGEDKNLAEQLLAAQDVDKSRPNKKDKKVWPAASRVVLHNEHLAQSADTRAWVLKLQKQQAITGTQLARRAGVPMERFIAYMQHSDCDPRVTNQLRRYVKGVLDRQQNKQIEAAEAAVREDGVETGQGAGGNGGGSLKYKVKLDKVDAVSVKDKAQALNRYFLEGIHTSKLQYTVYVCVCEYVSV